MATIQAKISRGHKYWYIVESRRVNGKPRPVVLAYLGKANDLLRRLKGLSERFKIKSFSHGGVSALLRAAHQLDVASIINGYVASSRSYMAKKPIRNGLTAGMTFVLAAIGRACMPTSKRGWWDWARTTSCEYLLRLSLSKVDSQHFWDLMDALPVESIEKIECELLRRTMELYRLQSDTLFFDTTNFFTFIASANGRSRIARRGRNKQKRNDLRQIGLAMVVTREDLIPLFHLTYEGNMSDATVFGRVVGKIKRRMVELGLETQNHTLVFDRGNNSKRNMAAVSLLGLHYVGALTPYHHQDLIESALGNFHKTCVDGRDIEVYRTRRTIWGKERTLVVFVSDKLRAGQMRGIYQALEKKERKLKKLRETFNLTKRVATRKQDKERLEKKIRELVKGQYMKGLIQWSLTTRNAWFHLDFFINHQALRDLEEELGFRILMTDRHDWSTAQIIKAYHGQSAIEQAFKNIKNPYHLALRPQFHWTDQKLKVHYFICVLGYLLATLVWREARLKIDFRGTLDTLLDMLNNIRLAALLETTSRPGRAKATYQLETMSEQEESITRALGIQDLHVKRPRFNAVGVYK